jgi:hypothetical protein
MHRHTHLDTQRHTEIPNHKDTDRQIRTYFLKEERKLELNTFFLQNNVIEFRNTIILEQSAKVAKRKNVEIIELTSRGYALRGHINNS